MRVHSTPTEAGSTFACSRRAIGTCFGAGKIDWISFGAIGKHFEFHRRDEKRPVLSGTIVAALTACPNGTSYLCLYPIRTDLYGVQGRTSFVYVVLPALREWLEARQIQAEEAMSSHKTILAEWTSSAHRLHEIHALYIPR